MKEHIALMKGENPSGEKETMAVWESRFKSAIGGGRWKVTLENWKEGQFVETKWMMSNLKAWTGMDVGGARSARAEQGASSSKGGHAVNKVWVQDVVTTITRVFPGTMPNALSMFAR